MTIYYAHPITAYGTVTEQRDIATLRKLGFEVYNPNSPEDSKAYKEHGMKHFCGVIRSDEIDAVAFRAFPDGKISAGVMKEIMAASGLSKPYVELNSRWTEFSRRALSVEETRQYIKQLNEGKN